MHEKILCLIGARGGSKGVPGKNIMPLHGKPLIGWTIERGLAVAEITDLVVSTDDPAIADTAKQFGAKVPFMRPPELSNATAGKFQVWQHALAECENLFHTKYDIVLDMDCTNPLLEAEDVHGILRAYRAQKSVRPVDGMFTVSPSHRSPYFNLVEEDADGFLHLSKKPDKAVVARQAASKAWDIVAGLYVLDPNYLKRANGLLEGNMLGYEVPREKSFDIDEPFDVTLVEFLMSKRKAG